MKTYHLKWASHIPNMEYVFTELYESEGLADVSIMCVNGSLRAHRLILSTCSNYFLRLFLDVSTKRPVITLPEVTIATMRNLLAFIYTGEVQVAEERMEELLQAAEMLEIRGLTGGKGNEEQHDNNSSSKNSTPRKEMTGQKLSPDLTEMKENLPSAAAAAASDHQDSYVSPNKKSPLVSPNMRAAAAAIPPVPEISILPILPKVATKKTSSVNREDMEEEPRAEVEEEEDFAYATSSSCQSPSDQLSYPSNNCDPFVNTPNVGSTSHLQQDDIGRVMAQVSFPTCPICAKDCANFPNLRSHLQTHLNGKPFACEFCDAKFSRASHLCRHRRTHTGEKPFTCKKCGKTFSRQDKLKTHSDRHAAAEDITMFPAAKKPKGRRRNSSGLSSSSPLLQQQQQQQQSLLPMVQTSSHETQDSNRPWNNVAFPGFSNPFYPQYHHQQQPQVNDIYRFGSQQINSQSAIMSSLMKLGECSVQQVPK